MTGFRLTRRQTVAGLAASSFASSASFAASPRAEAITQIDLWPNGVPGPPPILPIEREIPRSPTGPVDDTAFIHVNRPCLFRCNPEDVGAKPNGASILLTPGGGYVRVAIGHGGRSLLEAFAAKGYASYLLKYRLPGDRWEAGPDAPLQDARRALWVMRDEAVRRGLDPERIAIWGGSAGGHLACRVAAAQEMASPLLPPPVKARAVLLLYPVNLMHGPHAHAGSAIELAKCLPHNAQLDDYAAQAMIGQNMPPTFLTHALDDTVVPVENSLSLYGKLREHRIPSEMHLIERGGHGFGWMQADGTAAAWPDQALAFLQRHGV